MAVGGPASADSLLDEVALPAEWSRAREYLGEAPATYWLATAGRDGKPHVRPILAVWADGSLFFCASESTRKIKNLALDPHCSISVEWERLDLVIEGMVVKVRDESGSNESLTCTRRRMAGASRSRQGLRPHLPLDKVAEGYRAMDERRAIKALLWP